MKKNIILLNVFIFSFLYTQDIKPMVGIPSSGAMNPKKETMSIIITYFLLKNVLLQWFF